MRNEVLEDKNLIKLTITAAQIRAISEQRGRSIDNKQAMEFLKYFAENFDPIRFIAFKDILHESLQFYLKGSKGRERMSIQALVKEKLALPIEFQETLIAEFFGVPDRIFFTSWDALMPIMHEIDRLEESFEEIGFNKESFRDSLATFQIHEAFAQVIEFIVRSRFYEQN